MNKDEINLYLNQLKNWCAYQERCQHDVNEKLRDMKIKFTPDERDSIVAQLISENFINEERYALAFAGGKFRIKKWGKLKIKSMLKFKEISDYSINKALQSIDSDEYTLVINDLVEKKKRDLKTETNKIKRNYKVLKFVQSRGFETDLILEVLKRE
ncbi:MAG: regulatory protein RecX [Bacteroidota bacterium]|jgi:regulatory protein